MIVTQITDTKRSGVKNIFVDGQFLFAAHYEIILANNIKEQSQISPDVLKKAEYEEQYYRAKKYCFDLLSRKDYTEYEIAKKLCDKQYDVSIVDNAVCYLKENGYVDDYRYAKNAVWALNEQRKYGKYKIKQYLASKKIDKQIIDELLLEFEDNNSDELNISMLIEKKAKGADLSDKKQVKKLYDMLIRKGYNYSQAKKGIESYINCEIFEDE